MSLDCLKNIIGVTRSECDCITQKFATTTPEDWYKSTTSGLFLDEVPGIIGISAVDGSIGDCDDLALWYQQSIETAKITLRDDLQMSFAHRYKQARKSYAGKAGGTSYTLPESLPAGYAGVWLQNNYIRGGKIKIKAIACMFQAGITSVSLYKKAHGQNALQPVQNILVSSVPGSLTNTVLTTPIELSMDNDQYYLLYPTAGVSPLNNNVSCGCGSSEMLMKQFVSLVGVTGSNLLDVSYWGQSTSAHGLALEIEVGCDADNILCNLYEADLSYKTVIAWSVLYKAAELVMEKVINSGQVNRYTLMSSEYMWGKRNHFRKEYSDRVNWMSEQINIADISDCYACQDGHKKIGKSGILV